MDQPDETSQDEMNPDSKKGNFRFQPGILEQKNQLFKRTENNSFRILVNKDVTNQVNKGTNIVKVVMLLANKHLGTRASSCINKLNSESKQKKVEN